ncbi:MAG: choice-of-anchor B family protein [Bacteroidia bacterium]|nr:choice-of-anchor B family protein [Bacteroidia bacterium]
MNPKKSFLLLLLCLSLVAEAQLTFPASNFTLISRIDPEQNPNYLGDKYSACWGWYQSAKNKEYAIACSQSGTYWVDVTNAASPSVSAYAVGNHTNAVWREAKTYQNYCYVICDDNSPNSFQIFDMQNLPASVNKLYDGKSLFEKAHTLWVDGNKLYVAGITYSNANTSSMNLYSLATPSAPVLLRSLGQDFPFINYVHDMFVRNDTIFASCGTQGLYVFKYNSVANNFSLLGSLSSYTAAGYNHSSALTPDGKTLVFTDEIPKGLPIKFANVSNPANIQILATSNQYSSTTPHNPFMVSNQYCFMSSYEEGLQLYDLSNPSAPFLAGYFDTYPQGGGSNAGPGNYEGQWGAYPYFPSKNIFALDQTNGIFMLKTNLYKNPGAGLHDNPFNYFTLGLYPNPVKDVIEFNIPALCPLEELSLSITNACGQLVLNKKINETEASGVISRKLKLNYLEPGFYWFNLYQKEELLSGKKFIISE